MIEVLDHVYVLGKTYICHTYWYAYHHSAWQGYRIEKLLPMSRDTRYTYRFPVAIAMTSHVFIEAPVKVNVSRCVLPCHAIRDADINPRCNDVTRLSEPEFQRCRVHLRHIHVSIRMLVLVGILCMGSQFHVTFY